MVSLGKETILRYMHFIGWTDTLYDMHEHVWRRPIAEGKASAGEIIAHLQHWDDYLISTVCPAVKNGGGMVFPEFDSFNKTAYDYAGSGVSQKRLLDEFKQTRLKLVEWLLAEYELAAKPVTANGAALCPHTGAPYSLLYIIHEFNDHDLHHKNQILNVLQTK